MYILIITYNFDTSYITQILPTKKEAIDILNRYLNEEVQTIKNECEYTPSVLDWKEDDICLVYASGYTKQINNRNYALEDCAYYRVFEIEN